MYKANLFITCIDTAKSGFEVSDLLYRLIGCRSLGKERPWYWMDLGNSRNTGQVVLSSIGSIDKCTFLCFQFFGHVLGKDKTKDFFYHNRAFFWVYKCRF